MRLINVVSYSMYMMYMCASLHVYVVCVTVHVHVSADHYKYIYTDLYVNT